MNQSLAAGCQPFSLPALDEAGEASVQIVLGRGSLDVATWSGDTAPPLVELDVAAEGDVEVWVDGSLAARGAALVLDGKIAVRISELTAETVRRGGSGQQQEADS